MPYTVLQGACLVLPKALYCTTGCMFGVTQCPILYYRVHVQCYPMPYTVLQGTCLVLSNALYCTTGYMFGVTQCPLLYYRVHVWCYPMPYTVLQGTCLVLPNALYCTAGYMFRVTQCPILYYRVRVPCYLMLYTVLQGTCSVLPNALYCTAGYMLGVETVKSLVLTLALMDNMMEVERCCQLSRLEVDFQVQLYSQAHIAASIRIIVCFVCIIVTFLFSPTLTMWTRFLSLFFYLNILSCTSKMYVWRFSSVNVITLFMAPPHLGGGVGRHIDFPISTLCQSLTPKLIVPAKALQFYITCTCFCHL